VGGGGCVVVAGRLVVVVPGGQVGAARGLPGLAESVVLVITGRLEVALVGRLVATARLVIIEREVGAACGSCIGGILVRATCGEVAGGLVVFVVSSGQIGAAGSLPSLAEGIVPVITGGLEVAIAGRRVVIARLVLLVTGREVGAAYGSCVGGRSILSGLLVRVACGEVAGGLVEFAVSSGQIVVARAASEVVATGGVVITASGVIISTGGRGELGRLDRVGSCYAGCGSRL
jgi:hypothetical protein